MQVNLTYLLQKIDILVRLQIGTIPITNMTREISPPLAQLDDFRVSVERPTTPVQGDEHDLPDYPESTAPTAAQVPGMSFLNVAAAGPRRASAPFLLEIEDNEPMPGPSSRMSSGRETRKWWKHNFCEKLRRIAK